MENYLKEINAVLGVTGSFICLSDANLAAVAMPDQIGKPSVENAARIVTQTINALEISGQRVAEADLVYTQGRLIVKNLNTCILVIACARNINLPLLNLTANLVAKKIAAEFKPGEWKGAPRAATPATARTAAAEAIKPVSDAPPSPLLVELEQEMRRLTDEAKTYRLSLHVIDSLATWLACPRSRSLLTPPEKRQIDLVARSAQRSSLNILFEKLGYQSNQRFNAFYGNRRLNFVDSQRGLTVDIYLDTFEMYHRLDLSSVMQQPGVAVPETILLLLRLQLVEISDAGLCEICALLFDHDLSVGPEPDRIDAAQITQQCAEDWGWFKTVSLNLDRAAAFAAHALAAPDASIVTDRLSRLKQSIDRAPKSLRWQTRARLGETVKWYETPIQPSAAVRPDMAFG
jgi:predicted regulator of Ras-like GTPase activity (Roadblock/LC7/MglB family)